VRTAGAIAAGNRGIGASTTPAPPPVQTPLLRLIGQGMESEAALACRATTRFAGGLTKMVAIPVETETALIAAARKVRPKKRGRK